MVLVKISTVGNSSSKPLKSTPIELPCIIIATCTVEWWFLLLQKLFQHIILLYCTCRLLIPMRFRHNVHVINKVLYASTLKPSFKFANLAYFMFVIMIISSLIPQSDNRKPIAIYLIYTHLLEFKVDPS